MAIMRFTVACVCRFLLMLFPVTSAEDIRLPPRLTSEIDPHGYNVIIQRPESTVTLPCEATGIPTPEYEWFKNDEALDVNEMFISIDSQGGTLTIEPFMSIHEGKYQCKAFNNHGTTLSDTVELRRAILNPPPPTTEEYIPYPAVIGLPLTVPCMGFTCYPQPGYRWALVEKQTDIMPRSYQQSRRVTVDAETGTLYFAHVEQDDFQNGNLYKCLVKNIILDNEQGGSYSRIDPDRTQPEIDSSPPMLLYSTTSPKVVLEGNSVRLKCFFSGLPAPSVRWTYAHQSGVVTDNYETELVIEHVLERHQGDYSCYGHNEAGRSDANTIYLDVQSSPKFLENGRPLDVNVTEGLTSRFYCQTSAFPPAVVTWMVNGEPLTESNRRDNMVVAESGDALMIRDVKKVYHSGQSDIQVIQCKASNEHGHAFASAYLNVLLVTKITKGPENVTFTNGTTSVSFECEANTDDLTPLDMTWLKDNVALIPGTDTRVEMSPGLLMIDLNNMTDDEVRTRYQGKYTCSVTNTHTYSSEDARFTVPGTSNTEAIVSVSMLDYWWVFLLIILFFLLVVIILCCCIYCQRNKGDSYPVDEKEREMGRNPVVELQEEGYHDYQRPLDKSPIKGSRASLNSAGRFDDISVDDMSLSQYGDLEMGRFNEDGSFIGEYDTAKRRHHSQGSTSLGRL